MYVYYAITANNNSYNFIMKTFTKIGLADIGSFINRNSRKMELSSGKQAFRLVYPEAII